MTDPMELVGRLEAKNAPGHINTIDFDTTEELLDLLTEAAACIREMVEALAPLAAHADHYKHKPDSWGIGGTVANGLPTNRINVGHCRRAKALVCPPAPGGHHP